VDRSLWLLATLRSWSGIRRYVRGLRTVKGMVLGLFGSIVFLPVLISLIVSPSLPFAPQHEAVRRFGPFVLLGYCLVNLLLSTGERVLYYSPAEVDLLFAGPYRRHQLLVYRFVGSLGASAVTALFLTAVSARALPANRSPRSSGCSWPLNTFTVRARRRCCLARRSPSWLRPADASWRSWRSS